MSRAKEISAFGQILLLIGLMIGGILLSAAISFFGLIPFAGANGMTEALSHPAQHIEALKFLQITQAICLFIIPAYFFSKIVHGNPLVYLKLNKSIDNKAALVVFILIVSAIPFINLQGYINSKLTLPDFLSSLEMWMQNAEAKAADMTMLLVSGKTISALLVNLIMIAALPAIGEEMIFRGILQRILNNSTRNIHIAVWASAFIFSTFHMQFYGFIPRLFLGVVLGYLYYYSGSLWLPILAHFINNAMATIFFFMHNHGLVSDQLDTIGTEESWVYGLLSACIFTIICFYMKRHKTELKLNESS